MMDTRRPIVPDEDWAPRAPERRTVELPGYHDFQLVARGGDSVVYRARQDGLDRLVAVKVLSCDQSDGPASAQRFQRELEITVRLGRAHPHIVSVLDTQVTSDGRPCIVMDFYDLGSLHDRLRALGPRPADEVIAVGLAVADALAFAHGQGVLHRDVKPQNILALPTSYVLADFGLARSIDAEHSSSLERFSYRHASPQVLDGAGPTVADDLYSLGSTLFTLLDGRAPFAADDPNDDSALAYLRRVRTEAPRPIRASAPQTLLALIERCLAKSPDERCATAGQLREKLATIGAELRLWSPSAGAGESAVPVDIAVEAPRWRLAPSAIEHLPAPPLVVAEPTAPRPPEPPAAAEEKPRWSRFVLIALVVLLVGAAVGAGGVWFHRSLTGRSAAAPTRSAPGQAIPAASSAAAGPTRIDDPTLTPHITSLDDRGDSVALRWDDPSAGQATFVIVDVTATAAVPLMSVSPGQTSTVVEGLNPAATRYCFHVLALVGADRSAVSPARCTPDRD